MCSVYYVDGADVCFVLVGLTVTPARGSTMAYQAHPQFMSI